MPPVDVTKTFEQAVESFEQAVEQLTDLAERIGSPVDWQKRSQKAFDTALPTFQKNFDEAMGVMNANAKTSIELLGKALETARCENTAAGQEKMREVWELALKSVRENTHALVQANTRIVESWTALAHSQKKTDGKAAK
jgi:hypothetical protein